MIVTGKHDWIQSLYDWLHFVSVCVCIVLLRYIVEDCWISSQSKLLVCYLYSLLPSLLPIAFCLAYCLDHARTARKNSNWARRKPIHARSWSPSRINRNGTKSLQEEGCSWVFSWYLQYQVHALTCKDKNTFKIVNKKKKYMFKQKNVNNKTGRQPKCNDRDVCPKKCGTCYESE